MNLSHTYAAPKPKSYVGVSLVVALHVAAIYAFSAGLIQAPPHVREVTPVKALPPDVKEPPPPTEILRAPTPTLNPPQPIPIPVPDDVVVAQEPILTTMPMRQDAGPQTATGPAIVVAVAQPQERAKPQVQAPGAVCSVMPQPEMPALDWSGEAVLQVIATVRGGRVVGTDFRVIQGALDGKTKRSLQRAAESALAGYQCQGDATFQQDFAFRVD